MIGKLKGIVDELGENWIIIDVNGVGYNVECASRVLANLPSVGEKVTLSIETHVRETEIRLFGFATPHERDWFRMLQSVQGVGAKVALAMLGTLSITELANAIASGDKKTITRTPGVGPKVATRIVTELKDKVGTLADVGNLADIAGGEGFAPAPEFAAAAAADAVSALMNLGYAQAQASAAISAAASKAGKDAKAEELIRRGLKELAQG